MVYMLLKMYIESSKIEDLYKNHIESHNLKMNDYYPDAGFDLLMPGQFELVKNFHKIDLKIKCAAYNSETGQPMSYYMYPRSSISKTPMRLANSVGIIDSGYRGNLMCAVDVKRDFTDCGSVYIDNPLSFTLEEGSRYFQICAPNLMSIRVVLASSLEELGTTTRGEGGFGSTGV